MVYNEVDALSTLLGYQVQNAGCCKVVFHPKWGSSVYPSTLFAVAPRDEVQFSANFFRAPHRIRTCTIRQSLEVISLMRSPSALTNRSFADPFTCLRCLRTPHARSSSTRCGRQNQPSRRSRRAT